MIDHPVASASIWIFVFFLNILDVKIDMELRFFVKHSTDRSVAILRMTSSLYCTVKLNHRKHGERQRERERVSRPRDTEIKGKHTECNDTNLPKEI